jgi:hypothetical protein
MRLKLFKIRNTSDVPVLNLYVCLFVFFSISRVKFNAMLRRAGYLECCVPYVHLTLVSSLGCDTPINFTA